MRLLLDTHVVLWWLERPDQLARAAYDAIGDSSNAVFVSAVTPWELALKQAKGQLRAPADLLTELERQSFAELAVSWEHGLAAGTLPPHHGDPFDRMLVAQARTEGLTILTRDLEIAQYDVQVMAA